MRKNLVVVQALWAQGGPQNNKIVIPHVYPNPPKNMVKKY